MTMSEAAEESLISAEASAVSDTGESITEESNQPAANWFLADETPGSGDRPEWFKEKYKSVADQAKAYAELEKRFGGFTGAPEGDYELTLPEEVEGEFDMEDPRLSWFMETAKESNMSQDTFNRLLHGWIQHEVGQETVNAEQELQALGANAQSRLKNLGDWGRANLDPQQFDAMRQLATTAAGVQVLEAIVSKTREAKMPSGNETIKVGTTEQELREMVADPRYQSSAAYRKEVERKYQEFYGTQPYQNVV
jgi:hypothetical protein